MMSVLYRYVYEGKATPRTFEEAQGLFLAARKYLLPESALDACRGFMWASIYPDNIWQGLQFTIDNQEEELYAVAVLVSIQHSLNTFKYLQYGHEL